MNTPIEDIIIEITKETSYIEINFPEVYLNLDELPMTIPEGNNPEIDLKTMQDYLENLKQIADHYKATHKEQKE